MRTIILGVLLGLVFSSVAFAGPSEEACALSLTRTVEVYNLVGGTKDAATATLMGSLIGLNQRGFTDMRAKLRAENEARFKQLQVLAIDEENEFQKAMKTKLDADPLLARGIERQVGNLGVRFQSDELFLRVANIERMKHGSSALDFALRQPKPASEIAYWSERLPAQYRHMLGKHTLADIQHYIRSDIVEETKELENFLRAKRSNSSPATVIKELEGLMHHFKKAMDSTEKDRLTKFVATQGDLVLQLQHGLKAEGLALENTLMRKVATELPSSIHGRTVAAEIKHIEGEQDRLEREITSLRRELSEDAPANVNQKIAQLTIKAETFAVNSGVLDEAAKLSPEAKAKTVKQLLSEGTQVSKLRMSVLAKYLPMTPSFSTLIKGGVPVLGVVGAVAFSGYFAETVSASELANGFKDDPRKLIDSLAKKQFDVKRACLEIGRLPLEFTNQLNQIINHYSMLAQIRAQKPILPVLILATIQAAPDASGRPANRPTPGSL